jgi:hypothetical protein
LNKGLHAEIGAGMEGVDMVVPARVYCNGMSSIKISVFNSTSHYSASA